MSPRRSRRRGVVRIVAGSVAAVTATVVALLVWPGGDSSVPAPIPAATFLDLYAPRDVGVLPSRASWCTLARTAEHCYLLQESSGDALDTGSGPTWDLTPQSAMRQGGHTPIPVAGSTVDTTSEQGGFFDGITSDRYVRSTDTTNLTSNLVSVSFIIMTDANLSSKFTWVHTETGTDKGYGVTMLDGKLRARTSGSSVLQVAGSTAIAHTGPRCVTVVMDGLTANQGRIYLDGVDDTSGAGDLSTNGSWIFSGKQSLGGHHTTTTAGLPGALYRLRVDYAAISLAQHQAICGTLWALNPAATSKLNPVSDLAWTQTGAARCYAQSATTAVCIPGGLPGHVWTSALSGLGFAMEPDRTNRVLDAMDVCSTGGNWTVGGAATATCNNSVSPDGTLTGCSIVVGAAAPDIITQAISGYGNSATLYPRFWVKCSSGTLTLDTTTGAGDWDIDCSVIAGAWTELAGASHAAVTENTGWASDGAGDLTIRWDAGASTSADLWGITITETGPGLSVIPTDGAAKSTGDPTFEIDNDPANYFKGAKGKVTLIADYTSGGCLDITDGSNTGRMYMDGVDTFMYDSSDALQWQADSVLAAKDTVVIRWNTGSVVNPSEYAEVLVNTAAQSFDDPPSLGWTSTDPTAIQLHGYGATQCTAAIERITIGGKP